MGIIEIKNYTTTTFVSYKAKFIDNLCKKQFTSMGMQALIVECILDVYLCFAMIEHIN